MTTETTSVTSVTAVVHEQNQSFLFETLQLKALAKLVARTNKKSVDALEKLLESKDEKIVMQAAIKLLELDIDIKKAMSQDQIQRLIAEIKLNRGLKTSQLKLEGDDADEDDTPIVDFTQVRMVN